MKILHVIPSVSPTTGGPAECTRQLASVVCHRGHSVEIASLDSPEAPYIKNFPFPVHPLGPALLKYGFSRKLVPWLRDNVRHYDVVVINGIWQYHAFATWKAVRNSSTPYVVFTHGMLSPWFKKQYPLKHLKKWMYWPWADYRVLRDARAALFTCEEERALAQKSFWLYRCNEVVVNYGTSRPSVDPTAARTAFFNSFPSLAGKKFLLFLGRLDPVKSCDTLIRAFARVLRSNPEWRLVMAGPDPIGWQKELEAMADRLGVAEQITWTGMTSGDVKWGAFHAAEALVLPSHQENFGMVVAEALACGLPTLISNKVNIWREIQSDRAGLVANDDLDGISSLISSWTSMSETEKHEMRERSRQCFLKRFEINKAAESFLKALSAATN